MTTLAQKLPYSHQFAGGYPRVGGQPTPTDPDCLDYLSRVAEADGAGVEVGVAMAIQSFIQGCKADSAGYAGDPSRSNWDAIQAACIMAGARTIAGATVPLKTPYGPELWTFANPSSIDISGSTGLVASWDSASYTMIVSAPGTSSTRPIFYWGGLSNTKRYRVDGVMSGDITRVSLNPGVAINTTTGVVSGVIAGQSNLTVYLNGQQTCSVTIESLSIREDSFTPTPYNFASGDYARAGATPGLKGNGVDKYIDSNRANDADGQDDQHVSVFSTVAFNGVEYVLGRGTSGLSGTTTLINVNSDLDCRSRNGTSVTQAGAATIGLIGFSRQNSDSVTLRGSSQTFSKATTSQLPAAGNIYVFGTNGSGSARSDARLAFYSIGSALDLSLLDARVTALVRGIQFAQYTGLSPADFDDATVAYIVAAYIAGGDL